MLPPGMDIYADILARLPEYRAGKKGVVFRCPFGERHERGYDRTPSAGAWLGSGGQLIVRCMACKADFPMFVELTGVPPHQWFPDRHRFLGMTAHRVDRTPKRVAAWEYLDADSNWVGTKERFEPGFRGERKTYVWRWPNGERNDLCPLYCLPEVLAQNGQDEMDGEFTAIHVTEGEKAADTLRRHGFTATCSPHGSNQWLPVHSGPLEGRWAVLWPDNDRPGREFMEKVAGALARAGVAKLTLVAPGQDGYDPPASGGDVTDWLAKESVSPRAAVIDVMESAPTYQLTARRRAA